MEAVSGSKPYYRTIGGQNYVLRRNGNELTLHQITNEGEKLVADKEYLDNNYGIMRRGYSYDHYGKTIVKRHSITPMETTPSRYGYIPFQVRDLGYNGEGLSSGFKFKLIGEVNYGQSIKSLVTWGSDKSTVATFEQWQDLGPLAKRYLVKLLEYTKVL